MIDMAVTLQHIRAARERIAGKVERTPSVLSQSLSDLAGHPVHLKLEHHQTTGAVTAGFSKAGNQSANTITQQATNVAWSTNLQVQSMAQSIMATGLPPERCFAVAVDFERYPEWATDVKKAEVLDRDEAGRGSRVRYEVSALGRTIGYTLAYDYGEAPAAFSWTLVQGDIVKGLDGQYRFEPSGDGTRVVYRLAVEVAIPLPGFVKRRAAGLIAENAMRGLRRHLEGGAG